MILKNNFVDQLLKDRVENNFPRQVDNAMYSVTNPTPCSSPYMIHKNDQLFQSLNLDDNLDWTSILSGNHVLKNTVPYAMCYGGHQFGHWAGQLGDGRAINLFEVESHNKINTIQLKGAGPTPYSRSGDGYAVLRSSVREYLVSEAMYHLGVPTTRSLSLILSGDNVTRDMFYNGNPKQEKGAIVSRVAESFLRFGNYQMLMARGETDNLKMLVDFTIKNYFSHLGDPSKETYIEFFKEVTNKTLEMIIHWQRVGFVHGVMNTDNMSILGLTIDYGPYGWQDDFDLNWTPNTSDSQNKRYRFGAQPEVALWNLLQLANAIYPLVEESQPFEKILDSYKVNFKIKYYDMMRSKLGWINKEENDIQLIQWLEELLSRVETDMTIFYRTLSKFDESISVSEFNNWYVLEFIRDAFYQPENIDEDLLREWNEWFISYSKRLKKEEVSADTRHSIMNKVNPKFVLRNYMAQLAIEDAEKGDYDLINELFELLKNPYDEQDEYDKWFAKRPDWAKDKPGSSMLSCSS